MCAGHRHGSVSGLLTGKIVPVAIPSPLRCLPPTSHLPGNGQIFEVWDFGPYYEGPLLPGVINGVINVR